MALMTTQARARLVVILTAPVLFWILATAIEVARRNPEALETPLAYLVFTWIYYEPVFACVGVLLIAGQRFISLRSQLASWIGAVAGGGLTVVALSVAAVAYGYPMRVWRLCFFVGALTGAMLLRIGQSDAT